MPTRWSRIECLIAWTVISTACVPVVEELPRRCDPARLAEGVAAIRGGIESPHFRRDQALAAIESCQWEPPGQVEVGLVPKVDPPLRVPVDPRGCENFISGSPWVAHAEPWAGPIYWRLRAEGSNDADARLLVEALFVPAGRGGTTMHWRDVPRPQIETHCGWAGAPPNVEPSPALPRIIAAEFEPNRRFEQIRADWTTNLDTETLGNCRRSAKLAGVVVDWLDEPNTPAVAGSFMLHVDAGASPCLKISERGLECRPPSSAPEAVVLDALIEIRHVREHGNCLTWPRDDLDIEYIEYFELEPMDVEVIWALESEAERKWNAWATRLDCHDGSTLTDEPFEIEPEVAIVVHVDGHPGEEFRGSLAARDASRWLAEFPGPPGLVWVTASNATTWGEAVRLFEELRDAGCDSPDHALLCAEPWVALHLSPTQPSIGRPGIDDMLDRGDLFDHARLVRRRMMPVRADACTVVTEWGLPPRPHEDRAIHRGRW